MNISKTNEYLWHSLPIAKMETDGSLTVYFPVNSKQYNEVGLPELVTSLGNPILNYKVQKKKITSVLISDTVKAICKSKYGSLSKALEYAANV